MFLVDTNVISSLAPNRSEAERPVADWLSEASPWLYMSSVTVAEVIFGIERAERQGALVRARRLRAWWVELEQTYQDRILPLDKTAAHALGVLRDRARAANPEFEDLAIAATAQTRGLTVLTRNLRHFEVFGVPVIDPFKSPPALG